MEEQINLISHVYNHRTIGGKHFTVPIYGGINTVIYEVYRVVDYKTLSKYYKCKPIEFKDNLCEERIKSRTFFIDDPQEDGNQIILLHFDINNNRVILNTGVLLGEMVKITKCPTIFSIQKLDCLDELWVNSDSYSTELCTEAGNMDFFNNMEECQEKWFEIDIKGVPPVMIDAETTEQVQNKVYYSKTEKSLKARIKLERYKSYFGFQILDESSQEISPLTSLEKGEYYKKGRYGFPKDLHKAIRYFEKDSSAKAFFEIATIFRDEPILKSDEMYYKYLCMSANLKCERAIVELALCVHYNETAIINFQECISLFDHIVQENYAPGIFLFAYLIEKGLVENKDRKKAFELYIKAALNDYKPALARFECNFQEDIKYLSKNELYERFMDTILKNTGESDYCLGSICFFGIGIKKRKKKGLDLLLKSADYGNINAQYTLFEIFDIDNEYMDKKRATKWLEIVSKSTTSVYLKLSNRLLNGVGCEVSEENDKYAFSLLQKSALDVDKTAINNLGWMYKVGRGCTINYEQARRLFEKAASLGSGTSYFHLGHMYEKGLGVKIDIDKAKGYYSLAIEMGNEKAKQYLKNIGNS